MIFRVASLPAERLGSAAFEISVVPMAKSGFAKDQLKSFINRIERLEEERAALSADIREVYSEAKGTGFDTKIMASPSWAIPTCRARCRRTLLRFMPATCSISSR